MNYYEVLYIVNPNYGKDKISEIINLKNIQSLAMIFGVKNN